MIKLIASDLDGTIIDNKHLIPDDNIKAIADLKKANIPFVVCTGKTYSISKDICKHLNASYGIFGNGSQIIDLSTGEEISRRILTLDEVKSCFSVTQKYNLHVHAYTENGIVTTNLEYMDLRNSILFSNKINFEVVDSALINGDTAMLSAGLNAINELAASSPFKALADFNSVQQMLLTDNETEFDI